MSLRHLRVLGWIALYLLVGELLLEIRSVRRGWGGVLLGVEEGVPVAEDSPYGPKEGFPFRSLVIDPERRDGVERIWVASSSYGEDTQVVPEELFAQRICDGLDAGGRPAEVLNASTSGFWIPSNTSQLRELGGDWDPDVVVLYQMSNDVDQISTQMLGGMASGGAAPGGAGEAEVSEADGEDEEESSSGGPNVLVRFVEQTIAYKHIKSQITARLSKARVLHDHLDAEAIEVFDANVRDFLDACREVGARPVLCTFATSHTRADLDQVPETFELNLLRFNIYLSLDGWKETVGQFNDRLREIAVEEGVLLVDVEAALEGRSEHFRDFWHFKPEGHRIVGEAIASALLAEGTGE